MTPPREPITAAAPATRHRAPVATTTPVELNAVGLVTSTLPVIMPPSLQKSVPEPVELSDADDDSSEEDDDSSEEDDDIEHDDDILADMGSDDEEELLNAYMLKKVPSWDEYLFPEPQYRFCGVCF